MSFFEGGTGLQDRLQEVSRSKMLARDSLERRQVVGWASARDEMASKKHQLLVRAFTKPRLCGTAQITFVLSAQL